MTVNGTLDLNGQSVTVDDLSGGALGIVTSNSADDTLNVQEDANGSTFFGTIEDGSSGSLALAQGGSGTLTLAGERL